MAPVAVAVGGDIDNADAEAQRRGYGIIDPPTQRAWACARFFVRDPDGNVINIDSHLDNGHAPWPHRYAETQDLLCLAYSCSASATMIRSGPRT